ncbi:MAG: LysR family transcriptional regulator [Lachnospiraceae bacterium]|nr:LysR family transcriptional regulator [Lachnospiraceae bacterium]
MIMMNNNLRVFIQVADKGSFTATANELFVSQPAISRAIKALEDELKLKLFFRDKRKGLILTDAGQKVLILARQMADMENRIYQTAFRENNFLGGKVRIASMPILTSVILSKVFYQFRQKYPYVTLELAEGSSSEIRTAVEEHKVDFGFTSSPFGTLDNLVLLDDRMVAISKEDFKEEHVIDLHDDSERYIFCHAGHETVLDELKTQKVKLEHSFTVQQAETVIKLVSENNGIGILSELVLNATPNSLKRHSVEPSVQMAVGLVANDLSDLTPVATALLRMIQDTCIQYQNEHNE